MIRLDHLRRDNADHPEVPGGVAEYDGCWRRTVVLLGNALVYIFFHGLLQGTSLLVHRIEELGKTPCLVGIASR